MGIETYVFHSVYIVTGGNILQKCEKGREENGKLEEQISGATNGSKRLTLPRLHVLVIGSLLDA